jgi:hypothetical protein
MRTPGGEGVHRASCLTVEERARGGKRVSRDETVATDQVQG